VGFASSSKKSETREVKCPGCGTVNQVDFYGVGGTITIFCKECGEEIRLVFNRTAMGMELKSIERRGR